MEDNAFNVRRLFKQRLNAHITELIQVYKSAIDWVIWLYVFIPAGAILCYQYASWWQTPWELTITPNEGQLIIFIGLFLFIFTGNVRLFLESADQLFFRQNKPYYRSLMKLGLSYSTLVQLGIVSLLFMLIAPILIVQFHLPIVSFIGLLLLIWLLRLALSVIKQFLYFRWQGWRYYLIYTGLILVSGIVYSGILYIWNLFAAHLLIVFSVAIVFLLNILLFFYRINKRGTFQGDIAREVMLKYRFTSLALQSASFVGAPNFQRLKTPRAKKRPWLFRKSGTIFSKRNGQNAFIELHIKYLIRNKSKWGSMLQLMSGCLFALLIAPELIKWIIWFIAILVFIHLNNGFAAEMKQSTFLKTFDWDQSKMISYTVRSVFLTNLPFVAIIGAWAGGLLLPWWGFFVFSGITVGMSYLLQFFMIR